MDHAARRLKPPRRLTALKQRLSEQLSPAARLALKRLAFAPLRAGVRLAGRLYRLAERVRAQAEAHGLDLRRAWDVRATPRSPLTQQWGATDFLFLMDAVNGRAESLDPERPVRTSVVMLCYNKADLTFQSLRSLVREVDLSDTEIIVVNNASRDETRRVLDYFGGHIRAVHSEVNLGFVHGCNEGARVSRGKYLLFLNNDTVVLPGWLENLVEAVDADPRVGAAGPMFIYPDWTLQEAGGVIWRDAGALQYGRGKSPEDPRFNFAREVDYCSGASLLVRKDLFDRLGGFDARIMSDVPVGSGLSSSAALEVGLLRALRTAFALDLDDVRLALIGQRAENEFVGARVGVMDQMAASLADEGTALFLDTRSLAYERVTLPADVELVVLNSGVAHDHAAGDYNTRRGECERAAALLGVAQLRDLTAADLPRIVALPPPLDRRARHVVTENARVLAAVEAMRTKDPARLGELFAASHDSMRDDYDVSIAAIDLIVALARAEPRVYGARLTGGGFGGSVVMLAHPGVGAAAAARIARRYGEQTGHTATVLVPVTAPSLPEGCGSL